MDPWKLEHFKIWALPTATFSIMLLTRLAIDRFFFSFSVALASIRIQDPSLRSDAHSLKALPLVAVATTVVFRNLGTVFVAIGDSMFFGKEFNTEMKQGIGIILFGSLVYSYFDLNFDYYGYAWMSLNTVIFAINVLYEKYAVVSVDQTAVGVSCYQNILSLPLLTVMLVSTGESTAATEWGSLSASMQGTIFLTGVFGCLLSICYMSLNKFASPTAITIASNLNKLVSAIVGRLVFHNAISPHTVLGLLICMGGGYYYSNAPKIQSKSEDVELKDEEVGIAEGLLEEALKTIDGDDGDEDKLN